MRKNLSLAVIAVLVLLFLGTCSAPGDEGAGTVAFSFASSDRHIVQQGELANMEYEITFTKDGETVVKRVSGTNTAIQMPSGKWVFSVRAYGDTPSTYNTKHLNEDSFLPDVVIFPNRMLRGMSEELDIEIRNGQRTSKAVQMTTATEVTSFHQLMRAALLANHEGKEEIILISDNITFKGKENDYNEGGISTGQNIRLIADKPVTIQRGVGYNYNLIVVTGSLTLGGFGMKGSLTFNGAYPDGSNTGSIFKVGYQEDEWPYKEISGSLVMYDNVTLTKNISYNGGGVCVQAGTFNMRSGKIIDNKENSSSGGGVHVMEDGVFNMHSGEISYNNTYYTNGGGVYVYAGTFNMYGGDIKSNKTHYCDDSGGGVYVESGTFNKQGGTISGNEIIDPSYGSSFGRAVYASYSDALNVFHYIFRDADAGSNVNLYIDQYGNTGSTNANWVRPVP